MGKRIKRYKNIVEQFLSGEKGQRFFNAAYSLGAAVVILGALFKILHLPLGNLLLCIGMGTEVLMFVLTAFDRPDEQYKWDEVFPVLGTHDPEDRPSFTQGAGGTVVMTGGNFAGADFSDGEMPEGGVAAAGGSATGFVGGGFAPASGALTDEQTQALGDATQLYLDQMAAMSAQMERLKETTESLNHVSSVLLDSYRSITDNSDSLTSSSSNYVAQMEALSRNMSDLNAVYGSQLQGIHMQMDSMNRMAQSFAAISAEPERMANNMRQLNMAYERMINAMNPYGGAGAYMGGMNPYAGQQPYGAQQPYSAPMQNPNVNPNPSTPNNPV